MSLIDELDELAGFTRDLSGGGRAFVLPRRPVVGPLGRFPAVADAAWAVGINPATMVRWCQTGKNGWRYADA